MSSLSCSSVNCRPGRCCGGTHKLEGMQEEKETFYYVCMHAGGTELVLDVSIYVQTHVTNRCYSLVAGCY